MTSTVAMDQATLYTEIGSNNSHASSAGAKTGLSAPVPSRPPITNLVFVIAAVIAVDFRVDQQHFSWNFIKINGDSGTSTTTTTSSTPFTIVRITTWTRFTNIVTTDFRRSDLYGMVIFGLKIKTAAKSTCSAISSTFFTWIIASIPSGTCIIISNTAHFNENVAIIHSDTPTISTLCTFTSGPINGTVGTTTTTAGAIISDG